MKTLFNVWQGEEILKNIYDVTQRNAQRCEQRQPSDVEIVPLSLLLPSSNRVSVERSPTVDTSVPCNDLLFKTLRKRETKKFGRRPARTRARTHAHLDKVAIGVTNQRETAADDTSISKRR